MTPEPPNNPRAELESRLTALLLGELPADEAADLRERIAQDAELAKLYTQLDHTIELVRETAATPAEESAEQPAPLRLADERREKLLARFKTIAPKEFAKVRKQRVSWAIQAAAAVAVLGLMIAISVPNFVKSRTTSFSNSIFNNLRQIDGAKQQWALEHNKSAADRPTFDDLAPYLRGQNGQPPSIAGESYKLGSVGEPVSAKLEPEQSKSLFTRFAGKPARQQSSGKEIVLSSDGSVTTTTDQMQKKPTPEVALLSIEPKRGTPWQTIPVQPPQAGSTITFANSSGKPTAKPESDTRDREKLRGDHIDGYAPGKPMVANNIVLPSASEVADVSRAPTATASPAPEGRHGFALLGAIQDDDQAANSPAASNPTFALYETKQSGVPGAATTPANLGETAKNPMGAFPEIADRNAFGLKPPPAPATPAEPPAPTLLARIELPKDVTEKPVGFGPSAVGSAEAGQMRRSFYRLAPGTGGGGGGGGGAGAPAGKSEIADLPSAPSVAAATPSPSSSPANAGDFFFTTGTTRDDVAALRQLTPGQPAASQVTESEKLVPLELKLPQPAFKGTPKDVPLASLPQLAEREKLAEVDKNTLSWNSYDGSTKYRQLSQTESAAAGLPATTPPPSNIDPATGLPLPLAAPAAQPEVPIRAKFADVAQADQKQKATDLDLYESLGRKPSLSLDTAASAGPAFDAEIKTGVASAPTLVAGGVGGQGGGGGNRSSGIRSLTRANSAGAVPPGLVPPAPGAVFLGYDDPGQFVPQAQAASTTTVGAPLVAQLPVPHWRAEGKDYYGEAPPGVTLPKDKTPFLGDLPLAGRLFHTDSGATDGAVVAGKPVTETDSDVKLQLADGLNQNLALNKSAGGTLALSGASDFSGGTIIVTNISNNGVMTYGGVSTLSGNVDGSQNWRLGTVGAGNYAVPAESNTKAELQTYNRYVAGRGTVPLLEKPAQEAKPGGQVADLQDADEKKLQDVMEDTFRNKSGRNQQRQNIALPSAVAAGESKPNEYSLSIVGYANVPQDATSGSLAAMPSGGKGISPTRTYTPVPAVGDAYFSVDQDAHKVVVVEDEKTRKSVSQSISDKREKPVAELAKSSEVAPAPKYVSQETLDRLGKGLSPEEKETLRQRIDTPTRQVLVEARLLETTNAVAGRGINWGTATNYYTTDAGILRGGRLDRAKEYADAKRNLQELQSFQKTLNNKIAAENVDVTLPKSAMVEIVDSAKPPPPNAPSLWERLGGAKAGEVASTARVKVEREQNDIQGMASPGAANGYDPYFIQTEFEFLRSEAILGKVVKDLKLDEAWAKKGTPGGKLKPDEAMGLLKKKLDLHAVKNTGLVEIKAKSDKPEEAAKIANAVAEAYKDHRLAQWRERTASGVRVLEGRSQEQEQKIREAQEKVDKLAVELKIAAATTNPPAANGAAKEPEPPKQSRPKAPAAEPQPEVQTCDNAFSTFSLNISDVSFKLALASLEKGQMPDAGSVRSEEFINAFDYRDPDPSPGAPIGYAFERARYPFAQNRDLIRFSLKTAALGRQAGRPLNLVLLLDNSGSMERADRVRIIHEALRVLAGQLQPKDKLSVITFARTARLVADGVSGSEAGKVVEEVSGLTPEGGTNLEEAMNTAYATALRHYLADGINRVVLLTDGAANLGNVEPEALKQKVEAHRKQGVALDCFGIGWEGYNDDLLEVLSRNGDGRYGFINSPEEAATEFASQLAGALHVAASDVKVQVEFNPKRVVAYRQIGYAKHQLTKQQFRDNTVDAAEIAAQEAGNALYVVEVNPRGEGPIGTVRVRYKVPGTSEYHEHEWEAPYTGSAVELEQASPAMRLAATASAFSEWLVSSPFAGEVAPDGLLGYLSGVPEVYGADGRPKKLEWAIRQAKSLVGK